MSQDSLQFVALERWSDLQSAFKKDWPRGISGFSVLETQRLWKAQGVDYGFKVYCPYGEIWNGMVAINEKSEFYEIIIQCPSNDTKNLEDALRKTNVIDWKRSIIVPFAPQHVIESLKKVEHDVNVELDYIQPSELFILERQTVYDDVNLPPNITFGLLTMDHLNEVDSTWPHRYPTSPWYFQQMFKTKSGYGLFLDNTLIAWVFIKETGTLLHLYTVEDHRRKGYAESLLKLVSNILLTEKRHVFAFCLKDNLNACKVYRKSGFIAADGVAWCFLNSRRK